VVTTTPPLVTVIGVGVGMIDVDDVVLEEVVEVELLEGVVVLLGVVELLVGVEDEAEVVAEDEVDIEDVVEVEVEVGVGVEEVLGVVGAVDVVGAAGGALLQEQRQKVWYTKEKRGTYLGVVGTSVGNDTGYALSMKCSNAR
jgi:hypothetical protein